MGGRQEAPAGGRQGGTLDASSDTMSVSGGAEAGRRASAAPCSARARRSAAKHARSAAATARLLCVPRHYTNTRPAPLVTRAPVVRSRRLVRAADLEERRVRAVRLKHGLGPDARACRVRRDGRFATTESLCVVLLARSTRASQVRSSAIQHRGHVAAATRRTPRGSRRRASEPTSAVSDRYAAHSPTRVSSRARTRHLRDGRARLDGRVRRVGAARAGPVDRA